jgi:uncharacterized protein (TIGR03435 family)
MLRNLLAERFHMVSHRESRNLPAYALIAAKGQARLPAPKDPASRPSHKDTGRPGTRTINCGNCTVAEFVKMLGQPEGRFLFDETGLTGTYDFALTYEPVYTCTRCTLSGPDGPIPPPPALPLDQAPPVLSVALDQQLGLKLAKKQMPVDVLVIDRIDRVPAPN